MRKKPSIALVSSPTASGPQPPKRLGEYGRALWDRVQREYEIADAGGVELLAQLCAAEDRAAELAASVDADGVVVLTKSGPREHPALKLELATRAFICRTIQRLGINLEVVKPAGRPSHGFGWKGPHADD